MTFDNSAPSFFQEESLSEGGYTVMSQACFKMSALSTYLWQDNVVLPFLTKLWLISKILCCFHSIVH